MLDFKRIQPGWLNDELIAVVLPPAPQTLKYRGLWNDEARQKSEIAGSETELDRLRATGVSLLWIDFYSGFGLEFEKAEMERSRAFIAAAHARGMRVATIVQFGALTPETLLLEESECQNWLQVNADGQHPAVEEDAFFRVRPCYNSESWLRYMERVCGAAVESGADAIHLDNTGYNAEPDTCRCPVCVAAFRDALRQEFGSQDERTRQAGRERWGHNTFTHVRPPVLSREAAERSPHSPHLKEWARFKTQSLAAALARCAMGMQKRNPECAISADLLKNELLSAQESAGGGITSQLAIVNIATGCLPPRPESGIASGGLQYDLSLAGVTSPKVLAEDASSGATDVRFVVGQKKSPEISQEV